MADTQTPENYAGDINPEDTWNLLKSDPKAVLIDVRTDAEWSYVGVVDLDRLGKKPLFLQWKVFPAMQTNPDFVTALSGAGLESDAPLVFLCRSGVRSKGAAAAMTAAGYRRCFNITEGFEGDPDQAKHRGTKNGWKVRGLPWVQG